MDWTPVGVGPMKQLYLPSFALTGVRYWRDAVVSVVEGDIVKTHSRPTRPVCGMS